MSLSLMDGAFIEGKDLNTLVENIQKKSSYKKLIANLKELQPFDDSKVEVKIAYQFKSIDTLSDSNKLYRSKFVELILDNQAEIRFDNVVRVGDKEVEGLSGSVVHSNGQYLTSFIESLNGEFVQLEAVENKGQLDAKVEEELPNNPSYVHDEELVQPLGLFDVCMPGGYLHCGKGCGDYGPKGGGTPINPVDSCCRAHDRCWNTFGDWDCKCDRILIDCAKQYSSQYPAAYATIYSVFAYNAC